MNACKECDFTTSAPSYLKIHVAHKHKNKARTLCGPTTTSETPPGSPDSLGKAIDVLDACRKLVGSVPGETRHAFLESISQLLGLEPSARETVLARLQGEASRPA